MNYLNVRVDLLKKEMQLDDPVMDILKDFYSNENYLEMLQVVGSAFDRLAQYQSLSQPDAVKKWKQSVKDYEKGTGDKLEIEEESIRGYVQPEKRSPALRAPEQLEKAQETLRLKRSKPITKNTLELCMNLKYNK